MTDMGHKRNCRIQMSLHEVEAKNQTEPYFKYQSLGSQERKKDKMKSILNQGGMN